MKIIRAVVSIDVANSVSVGMAEAFVRSAVFGAVAEAGKQSPLTKAMSNAHVYATEYLQDMVTGEEMAQARQEISQLKARIAELEALGTPITATISSTGVDSTLSITRVLHEFVRQFRDQSHIPPADLRQGKREPWKAGARHETVNVNKAVQLTLAILVGPDRPQPTDGQIFSYWIREAEANPGRVAKALVNAITPDDYRAALIALMSDTERELMNNPINPNGSLQL